MYLAMKKAFFASIILVGLFLCGCGETAAGPGAGVGAGAEPGKETKTADPNNSERAAGGPTQAQVD